MTAGLAPLLWLVLLAAPADFPSLISRGVAAIEMKDFATAQQALAQAVALRPKDPQAHYLLGRAYGEDKKNQPAAKHFREALELAPGHADALIDLASIEMNTGRFEEAAAHLRQALSSGPDARATRGLASILVKQGRTREAIESLRALARSGPADAATRFELGLALMQAGDCEAASGEFSAAVSAKPDHTGALLNLGNCLNRLGRSSEAARALESFRKISEETSAKEASQRRAYFLMLEADRMITGGDARGALKALEEAVRADPAQAKAWALLGQAREASGNDAGALAAFRSSADLDSTDAIVQVEIGRLLGKSGRLAEAIPYLMKAAQVDPELPEPHLFLAAAYQQMGRGAEAAAEEAIYRKLLSTRRPVDRP